MSAELMAAVDKVSGYRDRIIRQAKDHGPSAQFYIDLVATSKAIDRAHKAVSGNDSDEITGALDELRGLFKDGD